MNAGLWDPVRAAEWAGKRAGAAERAVLRAILLRFAALPFAPERAEREMMAGEPWTGAEVRLALRRLVRDGVLIERRRTWGEPQVQLPAAMVPVWQRLLCPVRLMPLPAEEARNVRPDVRPHRLPLSLELLLVWAELDRRGGLPLTRRGVPNRAAVARLAGAMRIGAGELAALPFPEGESPLPEGARSPEEEGRAPEDRLAPAGSVRRLNKDAPEWADTPPALRLALELGLACGTLQRNEARIAVHPAGLASWLSQSRSEADAALLACLMARYASRSPSLHLAAGLLSQLPPGPWFRVADAAAAGVDGTAVENWISLMAACGWMDGGEAQGDRVFRWKAPPPDGASARLRVLPDLEVWVPPEAGLRCRYVLEWIAERQSADDVFVYRLTREASLRAKGAGCTRDAVAAFLEREARSVLPGPVATALADWYGAPVPEGPGLSETEAMAPVARAILAAPGADNGATRPGGTSGDDEAAPPATEGQAPNEAAGEAAKTDEREAEELRPDTGTSRTERSAARAASDLRALFPGIDRIPPVWLRAMRRYHPSTARQLVEQALAWRTSLRMIMRGREVEFVPLALERGGGRWEARGFFREAGITDGEKGGAGNAGSANAAAATGRTVTAGDAGKAAEIENGGKNGEGGIDMRAKGTVRRDAAGNDAAGPCPYVMIPAVVHADEVAELRIELPAEIR